MAFDNEEEKPGIIQTTLQFLTENMKRIDRIVLMDIDDEGMLGSPVLVDEANLKIRRELEAEMINWKINGKFILVEKSDMLIKFLNKNEIKYTGFDTVTDDNFTAIKGLVKNAITEQVIGLSKEEEETKSIGSGGIPTYK